MGVLFYYVIFSFLLLCAIVEKTLQNENSRNLLYYFLSLLLISIAGFRGENVSRDYDNYLSYINTFISLRHYFSNPAYYDSNEPGIFLVIAVMQFFSITYTKFLFIVYATIAISLKKKAFIEISPWFGLTICIFFTNFFLLHEMTQIRGAVSIAFLLLALPDIYNKKLYQFLLKIGLASIFHYSALLIIPLYFLSPHSFNRRLQIIILFTCISLGLLNFTVFTLLDQLSLGVISVKLNKYYELLDAGIFTSINKLNILILIRIGIASFCIYNVEKFKNVSKYAYLILKIYVLSICAFYLFSTVPAIAFRINEMLGISEIILLPMLVYVIKEKLFALAFVVGFALLNLIINVQILRLVNPYF